MPLPPLTISQILAWADLHREQTGRWPTATCGRVGGCSEERWGYINHALRYGYRNLPGGTTLARLIAEYRGARNRTNLPDLSMDLIFSWATAHQQRTGRWPNRDSGPVHDAPGETWMGICRALQSGRRGLPGGFSLARLLAARAGVRNHLALLPLTLRQILVWADAHHARTGQWPRPTAGAIADAPGENWSAVDGALRVGLRRLKGGSSLYRLLRKHREGMLKPRPPVRIRQVPSARGAPVIRIELPVELLRRYRSGELGPADLARMCRVSVETAGRELRRLGVKPRPQGHPPGGRPAWHTEILRRYRAGQSLKQVARKMGFSITRVRTVLRRYGVALRPRGHDQLVCGLTPEGRKQLGRHVRALRQAAKLTREEVAARGGPLASTLCEIETGRSSPTRRTARRLAKALHVEVEQLVPSGEGQRQDAPGA